MENGRLSPVLGHKTRKSFQTFSATGRLDGRDARPP